MKYALINPNWTFHGSIYFGCREPHLPVEYGYARALLENHGHDVLLVDAHFEDLTLEELRGSVAAFKPDISVITTAPSYLFWRCAPPELRNPQEVVRCIRDLSRATAAVGPHGSTTPRTTLSKLGVDVVILGEFEELLPILGKGLTDGWSNTPSVCFSDSSRIRITGQPRESNMATLPALLWPQSVIHRHVHHHHRFDAPPMGPGAEVESSRGCPYQCTFCTRENFRNRYRERPLSIVMDEVDHLIRQGVEYIYFIDEIFLPRKELLDALMERDLKFGVQLRIDLWSREMIELLGRAGCVSIEAGIESLNPQGRDLVKKHCRLSSNELTDRLIHARKHIPFVQANLIDTGRDDREETEEWRRNLLEHGVWANDPVPVFPYPGSPLYAQLWGPPDHRAWERAVDHYLRTAKEFSDIQEQHPLTLFQLELRPDR